MRPKLVFQSVNDDAVFAIDIPESITINGVPEDEAGEEAEYFGYVVQEVGNLIVAVEEGGNRIVVINAPRSHDVPLGWHKGVVRNIKKLWKEG